MLNYLEFPELLKLLEVAKKSGTKIEAMIAWMAFTGTRISETLTLPLSAVLRDNQMLKMVHLPAAIAKGKRSRQLFIPDPLAEILVRYLWDRTRVKFNSELLFPGPGGRKLTSSAAQKSIRKLALEAIGRRITPHSLRHTFGTILARSAPIRVVQEALGHKSLASTQIYTHVNQLDLQKAVDGAFNAPLPKPAETYSPLKKAITEAFEIHP